MPVTQISRIQIRRGASSSLPQKLEEGEMAFTTDTGEVFIGAPNLGKIAYRGGNIYPYQNVRLITEFDLIHTMHDHVVTTGPLMRVSSPSRSPTLVTTFTFIYTGDPIANDGSGNAVVRIHELDWNGVGQAPGDLRGRVISKAVLIRGSDGNSQNYPYASMSVRHHAGPSTPNSAMIIDLDDAGLQTIGNGDKYEITFLNLDTIAEFPLAESNSFVMDYSMTSDELVNNLRVRRTGTLHIAADEYSVALVDSGVDLNQDPTASNVMAIIWSGHIEMRPGQNVGDPDIPWVILTCTNTSYFSISITFSGSRWAHTSE